MVASDATWWGAEATRALACVVASWAIATTAIACSDEPLRAVDRVGVADSGEGVADGRLVRTASQDDAAEARAVPEADGAADVTATIADVGPEPADSDVGSVDAATVDAPAKLGPPYPIVLAHGFFGTDTFAGLQFATYFYGVRDDLAAHGEALVFTPAVDPFQNSTARGAQLLAAIEAILAKTGHEKVVVIGHSQGGLDARRIATLRPDLVRAVVTFSTPHKGTVIADAAIGLVPWKGAQNLVDMLMNLAGVVVWHSQTEESSLSAAIKQLTVQAMTAFNAAHPDQPGVAYYSIAGRSAWALAKATCKPDLAVPFITKYDNVVDALDPAFWATQQVIDGGLFKALAHDGLVRVEDARRGTFLGCVPADHLDEIGHMFGDLPGLLNSFRHKVFYRELVAWLRSQGY